MTLRYRIAPLDPTLGSSELCPECMITGQRSRGTHYGTRALIYSEFHDNSAGYAEQEYVAGAVGSAARLINCPVCGIACGEYVGRVPEEVVAAYRLGGLRAAAELAATYEPCYVPVSDYVGT